MHRRPSGDRKAGRTPLRPRPRGPRVTVGLDFKPDVRLGPGKISLLEAVATEGSISGAARAVGLSYRHAWDLLTRVNHMFRQPVLQGTAGGLRGGGAALTPFGADLVRRYRDVEQAALDAAVPHFAALAAALR